MVVNVNRKSEEMTYIKRMGAALLERCEPGAISIGCAVGLASLRTLVSSDYAGPLRPFLDEKPAPSASLVSLAAAREEQQLPSRRTRSPAVAIQPTRIIKLSAVAKEPHPKRIMTDCRKPRKGMRVDDHSGVRLDILRSRSIARELLRTAPEEGTASTW